ncbi:ferric reductase [Aquaspirillum sp. LM1]|uniref:ferredoxin reductase family protein n=1 Tax=Aquaspirillum sp. LM1 TaxID=1938604 RepID=UPI0009839DA2|nr:ferric reductase-like transmembrane domain-containing protein [Aquaspirillum sp. LM1]AQR64099.1 ferric reductase [Aquaspirillum sp. LM1]
MKTLTYTLWLYLALLTGFWLLSDPTPLASLDGFFAWRGVLMQYSGVLGIGVMSLAMLLAMRPRLLEAPLGGLDKLYRLHKWLGISGLVISIAHWLLAKGPKWLVGLGWLERPARKPRPPLEPGSWQQLLAQQRGLAEAVGEWAFYAAAALMALALIKWFPYRRFVQTHRWISLAYLALVFHAIVLVKFEYWQTPVGGLLAGLIGLGCVAGVMSLLGRRAGGSKVSGRIAALDAHPELNALSIDLQLQPGWPGHQAGQFAFFTFHPDEGAHPFTLASAWQADEPRLSIVVKALGDYTATLATRLKVGNAVQVEGPYGRFTFAGDAHRQIWVGGGIGITPFLARLQALAAHHDGKAIDLFYATAEHDPAMIARLQRDADRARVNLHLLWEPRDGRLNTARLQALIPDWCHADVWFCGPASFGRMLREELQAQGLPAQRFHQEWFEMR